MDVIYEEGSDVREVICEDDEVDADGGETFDIEIMRNPAEDWDYDQWGEGWETCKTI